MNLSDNGKYLISEQGYAGFEIFLEIYFKGLPANDPVRKVRIGYDFLWWYQIKVIRSIIIARLDIQYEHPCVMANVD